VLSRSGPNDRDARQAAAAADPPAEPGLQALRERVRQDLAVIDYPSRPWLPPKMGPDGKPASDVVIVGGGMSGIAIAFALRREKLDRVRILDRAPAGREGPWATFARMETLRTPKHVLGPDLGIPSLTVAEWYAAIHGRERWQTLDRVPTADWMRYLVWLRDVLALDIENDTDVLSFAAHGGDLVEVRMRRGAAEDRDATEEVVYCRRLVFATGIDGSGRWHVPDMIAQALPPSLYAHTAQMIDFDRLAGKRIVVLGAGASAFDNAAVALEHGAAAVDLFYRRRRLPRVNPYRWVENAGFLAHFADMPDQWKWRFFKRMQDNNQPPPQDTFNRCARFENFVLHPGEPWTAVAPTGDGLRVTTDRATYDADFAIIGTGILYDLRQRPEIARYAGEIATWADRLPEAAHDPDPSLRNTPYLGPHYEYIEKEPGTLAWAGKVFNFTFAAILSSGVTAGALSGLKYGIQRMTQGIVKGLFLESLDTMFESFSNYAEPELIVPDEY
jgi:cation diffusion facilitator CzcD-associated flavoprotein CzcO